MTRGRSSTRCSPRDSGHVGYAQRAAQALMEEVLYDGDGNLETTTLATYPFLSATEVPSFELVDIATRTPYNALGVKGIGEAGTIGATRRSTTR